MQTRTIKIDARKYEHNIKSAWFDITPEMFEVVNLNMVFDECLMPTTIHIKFVDKEETLLIKGQVNEEGQLVSFFTDYYTFECLSMYNVFSDYHLTMLQDKVSIWK